MAFRYFSNMNCSRVSLQPKVYLQAAGLGLPRGYGMPLRVVRHLSAGDKGEAVLETSSVKDADLTASNFQPPGGYVKVTDESEVLIQEPKPDLSTRTKEPQPKPEIKAQPAAKKEESKPAPAAKTDPKPPRSPG